MSWLRLRSCEHLCGDSPHPLTRAIFPGPPVRGSTSITLHRLPHYSSVFLIHTAACFLSQPHNLPHPISLVCLSLTVPPSLSLLTRPLPFPDYSFPSLLLSRLLYSTLQPYSPSLSLTTSHSPSSSSPHLTHTPLLCLLTSQVLSLAFHSPSLTHTFTLPPHITSPLTTTPSPSSSLTHTSTLPPHKSSH